jgi:hypothetical protein
MVTTKPVVKLVTIATVITLVRAVAINVRTVSCKVRVIFRPILSGRELRGRYSKTCLKRNAMVPVFFSVFTGFRFIKGCVLK